MSNLMYRSFLSLLLCVYSVAAQQGDKTGEVQVAPEFSVPESPVLSPAEALKSFKIAPGFRIELVAAEPLIQDPVAITFDPDGRIWAVEMRGFMPNVDGKGEDKPNGRVVVLEDTDGDGRMDKSSVFLDGLVMPRGLALVRDGVLVAEPPKLWFCRDTDGDGKADSKVEVAKDYGNQTSPEHTANGLMWGLDNWIYSANFTARFRSLEEEWKRLPTTFRGQWGISQDSYGRLFFNSNSDQLRTDLVPSAYIIRNPNYRNPIGINFQTTRDQAVYPIRVNPGVNRGYRPGQLRPDGTLATFTAACGPVIYRGDNFPAEYQENAFVCEPAGNLVKRDILSEKDGMITAKSAHGKADFLASTDERFRPVNAYNGPDGALYIVDMYRGILQHRIFVTSYLRQQILSRKLETPVNLGRIYRIVHEKSLLGKAPKLAKAPSVELVKNLSHPNGWWRDTSQRLLVERAEFSVVNSLKSKALSDANPIARLHALWTLEGIDQLDKETIFASLTNANPKIRVSAIRFAEPLLKLDGKAEVLARLQSMAEADADPEVQTQLAFSFGESTEPSAEKGLITVAAKSSSYPLVREAIVSSLVVRELDFLDKLLADPRFTQAQPGRAELLSLLAKCLFTDGKSRKIERLLELTAKQSGATAWRQLALLDGMAAALPVAQKGKTPPHIKVVRFEREPAAITVLNKLDSKVVREQMDKVTQLVTWPGQAGYKPEPPLVPLTAKQQERFEMGNALYEATCAQCHQSHGLGQEGLAPPLADSEWVLGPDTRLVRMILHGVRGPITVKGRTYELDMPAFGTFDDEQIASILTYIRRSWEHTADAVESPVVTKARAQTNGREEAWSEKELLKIQ